MALLLSSTVWAGNPVVTDHTYTLNVEPLTLQSAACPDAWTGEKTDESASLHSKFSLHTSSVSGLQLTDTLQHNDEVVMDDYKLPRVRCFVR